MLERITIAVLILAGIFAVGVTFWAGAGFLGIGAAVLGLLLGYVFKSKLFGAFTVPASLALLYLWFV